MVVKSLARRVLALGSALVTSSALLVVAAQQPAAASTVRVVGTIDCLNNNYYGDTRDWYAEYASGGTSPSGTSKAMSAMTAIPATHAWQFDLTVPSSDTSVWVSARCSSGHQYGDFSGSGGATIPAGVSVVNAVWGCTTAPVNPGPWVTTCSLQSVSYS
ncbi:hypothetical protein ABGB17_20985 [Sphaerisporangium sp. B11E5]|uniref:hypothetical protein n=1 Tax=Sphaerisporangium sp. B11E5 TaxID=3153563 RepID=UPI00325F4F3D